MQYKKIKIETDGTSAGTKIFIDGTQVKLVQRLDFSADVNDVFTQLNVQIGRTDSSGELKKKKIKVRDPKTEKFVDTFTVETEPLLLERAT